MTAEALTAAPNRTIRLLLLLILSLSALVQFTVVSRTAVDVPLRADAGEYFSYAYNLTRSGVYSMAPSWQQGKEAIQVRPDAHRPPGYPLFLAAVGSLRPEPTEAFLFRVTLVQAGMGVLAVWLTFLIGRRFLGDGWACGAAVVAALNPHLATISTYILSESLFLFLLLAALLTVIQAVESPRPWRFVLAGVLWGACTLTRSTTQFLPLVLVAIALLVPRFRSLRGFALAGLAAYLAVLAPWILRNQSDAVDRSGPSLMVLTLAHGSYPEFMFRGKPESFGFPYRFDPEAEKITESLPAILTHIAGRFQAEPMTYARWYLIGKPLYFLSWGNVQAWDTLIYPVFRSPYYEDRRFQVIRLSALVMHWPLMLLGVLGTLLVLLRPRRLDVGTAAQVAATLVAATVLYAIVFHMVAAPFPRYAIPFRPLIYALALVPIRSLWLAVRKPVAQDD